MKPTSSSLLNFSCLLLIGLCLLSSCNEEKAVNWREELTGVGILSADTTNKVIVFDFNRTLRNGPIVYVKLMNDTLRLTPMDLRDFVKDKNLFPFADDSLEYLLTKLPGKVCLTRISGGSMYPEVLFFKRSVHVDRKMGFYLEQGWGDRGPYQLKVDSMLHISAIFYEPCKQKGEIFELTKLSREDSIFVRSFLHLLIKKRYDTERITDKILCGLGGESILLYNDSLYNYEMYRPLPLSMSLMPYLEEHFVKSFRKKGSVTMEMLEQPILLRKKYPSAITAVPPPPIPEVIEFLPPVAE